MHPHREHLIASGIAQRIYNYLAFPSEGHQPILFYPLEECDFKVIRLVWSSTIELGITYPTVIKGNTHPLTLTFSALKGQPFVDGPPLNEEQWQLIERLALQGKTEASSDTD